MRDWSQRLDADFFLQQQQNAVVYSAPAGLNVAAVPAGRYNHELQGAVLSFTDLKTDTTMGHIMYDTAQICVEVRWLSCGPAATLCWVTDGGNKHDSACQ